MKKVFILALLLLGSLAFGFDDITELQQTQKTHRRLQIPKLTEMSK